MHNHSITVRNRCFEWSRYRPPGASPNVSKVMKTWRFCSSLKVLQKKMDFFFFFWGSDSDHYSKHESIFEIQGFHMELLGNTHFGIILVTCTSHPPGHKTETFITTSIIILQITYDFFPYFLG